ncbi:PEP-CTERM sorting domain-containing protein [Planctomycetota bacterium]|nr:PEP-CTERM sorting domain-containing protein [Planctomycetota bacterium]
MRTKTLLASGLCIFLVGSADAATRNYDADFTSNPAVIDGIISAGEWDDAAVGGNWVLLRENGKADANNNFFKAKWDNTGIYLLQSTNYGGWKTYSPPPVGEDVPNWGDDQINFFFDPNLDNEELIHANVENDHYHVLLNQYLGTSTFDGIAYSNTNEHMLVASNVKHGERVWDGLGASTRMTMVNDTSGGVFEMFLAWEDLSYGADDPEINDLAIDGAPAIGDEWMFNCSRISTDANNFLPVWQDSGTQVFVGSEVNGWATMTFTPEPTSLAIFGVMGTLFLRRRK